MDSLSIDFVNGVMAGVVLSASAAVVGFLGWVFYIDFKLAIENHINKLVRLAMQKPAAGVKEESLFGPPPHEQFPVPQYVTCPTCKKLVSKDRYTCPYCSRNIPR